MNRDFENDNEFDRDSDLDGAMNRGQSRKKYGAGPQGTPETGQPARRPVSADDRAGQIRQSGGARRPAAPQGEPGGSRTGSARRPEQGRMQSSGAPRGAGPAAGFGAVGYGSGSSENRTRPGQAGSSAASDGGRSAGMPAGTGRPAGAGQGRARRTENGAERPGTGANGSGAVRSGMGANGNGAVRPGTGANGNGAVRPGAGANGNGAVRPGAGANGSGAVRPGAGANGSGAVRPGTRTNGSGAVRPGAGANGSGAVRPGAPQNGAALGGASTRPGALGSRAASGRASSLGPGTATGQTAASRTERTRFTGESGGQGGQPEWVELPAGRKGGERQGRSGAADGKGGKQPDPQVKAVKRKRRTIITLIILECFTLCMIFGARYVIGKMNMIQRDNSFNMKEMTNPNLVFSNVEKMKGYWTIALFGVDSRDNSLGRGNNADVNIICNVNQDTGEIKLVSVFRDTYLNLDDKGSYNKINQAYFIGGPEQAINALNKNLDLQIDDYAVFNWKAVVDAINILGGVDIELSKAEFYYINAFITETVKGTGVGSHQLTHAGMNHLDGVQAVAYARLRKMDTDFARTERQRKVIQLAFDKLKKADFAKVNNVMEVVLGQIQSSVDLNDLIPAAKNLTKYYIGATTGFPQARDDVNMGRKGDCVIPATLASNVPLLHQFLFGEENYEPSDMVKRISKKISEDTGLYKQAKPIDHVGTDGGYIPKPKPPKPASDSGGKDQETTKADEGTVETSAVIDGEGEDGLELETDEFGNEIDPPEGNHMNPSSGYPGSGQGYPGSTQGYPGSGQGNPGSGQGYPGSGQGYPGSGQGNPGPGQGYPGSSQGYPGSSQGYPGSGQGYPGGGQGYPGGGQGNPGNTSPTSPSSSTAPYPGAPGSPTSPDNTSGPGAATAAPSTPYPGSGAPGGGNSPYNPTMTTKPVKPAVDNNSGGPNSVITGPGGR